MIGSAIRKAGCWTTLFNRDLICHKICCISQRASSTHQVVFNKKVRHRHLEISARNKDAHIYDYLRDHMAKDLCDRVEDLKLDQRLDFVFNLGACSGLISRNLNPDRLNNLIQADSSAANLERCSRLDSVLKPKYHIQYMLCDEERLALKENSIDLSMSCLNLHWVNDLVGCFRQVWCGLRDNKAFIGCLFGGDTLFELRSSLQLAELERLSGFSSHIAPKTTGQDIANILHHTGYQLITVDITEIRINYPSAFELMFDLQGMGENNASMLGSQHMHRDILKAGASVYQALYGDENDLDKGVPATFQVIFFIGWKNPIKATPLKSAPS